MRILVTGGAGFIGSHTVEVLLAAGHRVRVFDNLSTGKRDNLPLADVELLVGDVRDPEGVAIALNGMDAALHLAAVVSVPLSIEQPIEAHAVNATGALHVLEGARQQGLRRVVLASSAAVYGAPERMPIPEEAPLRPMSPYGSHKRYNEECARLSWELHGLETLSLRYFNVFGPRQDPNSPYSGVLSRFIDRARGGAIVHGDGLQTRDFVDVEDLARANLAALTQGGIAGQVYNVGTGREVTVLEALETICRIVGSCEPPRFAPARAGDIRRSCADATRSRAELGWQAAVPFETGLARAVAWHQASPARA